MYRMVFLILGILSATIIGTTNYPEKIDPALINRAGRFDRAYEIPSPSDKVREQYLRKLDIRHIFTDEQFTDMAKRSKGLSMSQLNELYMSVALNWHYDGKLAYEERIEELLKQNKRSMKKEWENDEHAIGAHYNLYMCYISPFLPQFLFGKLDKYYQLQNRL